MYGRRWGVGPFSSLGLDRVAPLFLLFQVVGPIHCRDMGDVTAHQYDGVSVERIPSAIRRQTALRLPQKESSGAVG